MHTGPASKHIASLASRTSPTSFISPESLLDPLQQQGCAIQDRQQAISSTEHMSTANLRSVLLSSGVLGGAQDENCRGIRWEGAVDTCPSPAAHLEITSQERRESSNTFEGQFRQPDGEDKYSRPTRFDIIRMPSPAHAFNAGSYRPLPYWA